MAIDLTIPYTFYPQVFPKPLAWGLFLAAVAGAVMISGHRARKGRPLIAALILPPVLACLIFTSMVVSMMLTFFLHDQ